MYNELDQEITAAGMRGNVLPARPQRRHRTTRRRQDSAPLPRRRIAARTIGKAYTTPDGKTFRPSIFVTLTRPTYGRVREDGTPADPASYDYQRAARDALHFAALFDLRHTGNTLSANAVANLRELMDRMGHSSPRAALIYLHGSDERQQAIAAALSRRAAAELNEARDNGALKQAATGPAVGTAYAGQPGQSGGKPTPERRTRSVRAQEAARQQVLSGPTMAQRQHAMPPR